VADNARRSGHVAADRAVAIDSRNSEALYIKAMLADRHDWSGRAALLERAVSARRLDCGCEHHQYGALLADVGRVAEALEQLHQANDMLALYVYTPLSLANVLVTAGKPIEARHYFDAAIDLAPDQAWAERLAKYKAIDTFDIAVLENPRLPIRDNYRAAVLQAAKAAAASDPAARTASVRRLLDLRASEQDAAVALLLGKLGADHQAFLLASTLADKPYPGPMLFWHPWLRGALRDPGFPTLAARLGLLDYWRHAHVTPDVCNEHAPPPFCAMI
jgi:tetratricopeptide (TPR) repeat protein